MEDYYKIKSQSANTYASNFDISSLTYDENTDFNSIWGEYNENIDTETNTPLPLDTAILDKMINEISNPATKSKIQKNQDIISNITYKDNVWCVTYNKNNQNIVAEERYDSVGNLLSSSETKFFNTDNFLAEKSIVRGQKYNYTETTYRDSEGKITQRTVKGLKTTVWTRQYNSDGSYTETSDTNAIKKYDKTGRLYEEYDDREYYDVNYSDNGGYEIKNRYSKAKTVYDKNGIITSKFSDNGDEIDVKYNKENNTYVFTYKNGIENVYDAYELCLLNNASTTVQYSPDNTMVIKNTIFETVYEDGLMSSYSDGRENFEVEYADTDEGLITGVVEIDRINLDYYIRYTYTENGFEIDTDWDIETEDCNDIVEDMNSHPNDARKLKIDLLRLKNRILSLINVSDESTNTTKSDGIIDANNIFQGPSGDCWLLTGIISVCSKPNGKELINSLIEKDKNGAKITLKGAKDENGNPVKYYISNNELKNAVTLSQGDIDTRFIELAFDKYLKECAYSNDGNDIDIIGNYVEAFYKIALDCETDSFYYNKNINETDFNNNNKAYSLSFSSTSKSISAKSLNDEEIELAENHAYTISGEDSDNIYLINPWNSNETIKIDKKELQALNPYISCAVIA